MSKPTKNRTTIPSPSLPKERTADRDFSNWIGAGDEWILSYLSTPPSYLYGTVGLFSIAHALELYLKAYVNARHGYSYAVDQGHNLFGMYAELQTEVRSLPEITKEQFSSFTPTSDPLPQHYAAYLNTSHLLLPFKYIMDLKYPYWKNLYGQRAYAYAYPDERYATIFCEVRKLLSWNSKPRFDLLTLAVEQGWIADNVLRAARQNFLSLCLAGPRF